MRLLTTLFGTLAVALSAPAQIVSGVQYDTVWSQYSLTNSTLYNIHSNSYLLTSPTTFEPWIDTFGTGSGAPFVWEVSGGCVTSLPVLSGGDYSVLPTFNVNPTYGAGPYTKPVAYTVNTSGTYPHYTIDSITITNGGENITAISPAFTGGTYTTPATIDTANIGFVGTALTCNAGLLPTADQAYGRNGALELPDASLTETIAAQFVITYSEAFGNRMILTARGSYDGSGNPYWYVLYGYNDSGYVHLYLMYNQAGTTHNLQSFPTTIPWVIGDKVSLALSLSGSSPTNLIALCNDDTTNPNGILVGPSYLGAPAFTSSTYTDNTTVLQSRGNLGTAAYVHVLQITELTAYTGRLGVRIGPTQPQASPVDPRTSRFMRLLGL